MTKDVRFNKFIASGESETVEFKNSFDREVIETLAAFANTKGGKVFVGISDKGKVTGVQLNKESVQAWINQARQLTLQAIIPDAETIWLPEGITIEKLLKGNYVSNARNKKVAEVFKAAGLIERYGSGINRILNAFKAYGLPPPEFKEMTPGFMVTVYKKTPQVTEQVTEQVARLVTLFPDTAASAGELMNILTLSHRPSFLYTYLQPALDGGYIERTVPDKPQSRLQRYRLTQKGKKFREGLKK